LGWIDREDLQRIALPLPDAARRAARDRAIEAATVAGHGDLLEEGRAEIRRRVIDEYAAAGYRPTWLGLNWSVSTGRPMDRVALAAALDDAAVAAIAADLIPADDIAELTWPYERLAGQATGGPPPESLAFALRSSSGRLAAAGFVVVVLGLSAFLATGSEGLLAAIVAAIGLLALVRRRARASAADRK
jgi:hypothetical protein